MDRTNGKPRVVALCGSLRRESRTRIVLEDVLSASRTAGATTELVDLRSFDLPSMNARDGPVEDAESLRGRMDEADSLILGTPNYHGSFSGALKNALDYCRRDEFEETTVGLLEVAGGEFPGTTLVHLRTVSRTLHGWILPTEVTIPNAQSTVSDDGIADEAIASRARQLGVELVRYAGVTDYPEMVEPKRAPFETETDD
ncbi:NADPH-dependent FMN reductase [Halomontanus rarus]|uniref:NADPH-dependent FMN reductase n=1 Tax=Halomontanus rarus TaxID=3034020 RepID=UPI0023E83F3A|nr:NAD(P)H-dependent oxidoreductase [Halovivax sp. TS33]